MASFPGNPGMLSGAMNPNAGMSEQEQQMVKAVRNTRLAVS
jgi:import inner membrane translocase subunit TIM22